jgi:hypothetical protein
MADTPLDTTLSRATGTRWQKQSSQDGSASYRVSFIGDVSEAEIKDAISRFSALVDKEFGEGTSKKGVSISANGGGLVINEELAKKIADRYTALQEKDKTPFDHNAHEFKSKFSGNRQPFSARNFALAEDDANYLANLAKHFPGFEKPAVNMGGNTPKFIFKEEKQAEKFIAILQEARKKAGISEDTLPITISNNKKTITINRDAFECLSAKEAVSFFLEAKEAASFFSEAIGPFEKSKSDKNMGMSNDKAPGLDNKGLPKDDLMRALVKNVAPIPGTLSATGEEALRQVLDGTKPASPGSGEPNKTQIS